VAEVTLRPAEECDVESAGDLIFVAFHAAALAHGLEPGVTTPGESRRYVRYLLSFDALGGVVAEEDGVLVGVGWIHPRGPVATLGPLAVDPRRQGRGIGRRLLMRLIEGAGQGVPQVRLVQESYNAVSLGLYLRAGFRVVAPLLDLVRASDGATVPPAPRAGVTVRMATGDDRSRIVARDARAFGAPRSQSVDLYLRSGRGLVAERGGVPAGFALGIGFEGMAYLGSASAEDTDTLLALLAMLTHDLARPGRSLRTLVPATDRGLVEGLLGLGYRVFRACHYMVRGGGTAPPLNYVLMNGDMM
jgi:GNAT superfamily N-acetyltransferase